MIEYLIDGPLWYFSLAVFCIGGVVAISQYRVCEGQNRPVGRARFCR